MALAVFTGFTLADMNVNPPHGCASFSCVLESQTDGRLKRKHLISRPGDSVSKLHCLDLCLKTSICASFAFRKDYGKRRTCWMYPVKRSSLPDGDFVAGGDLNGTWIYYEFGSTELRKVRPLR